MKRLSVGLALGVLALTTGAFALSGGAAATTTTTVVQHHSFGTITSGSTACVGPIGPSTTAGVQIFGFTNGATALTWQVFSVSSQSAPTLVFQVTSRSVSHTVAPSGNVLYQACVKKTQNSAQDYDLTLNSQPLE